jgi:hypothetical protein
MIAKSKIFNELTRSCRLSSFKIQALISGWRSAAYLFCGRGGERRAQNGRRGILTENLLFDKLKMLKRKMIIS